MDLETLTSEDVPVLALSLWRPADPGRSEQCRVGPVTRQHGFYPWHPGRWPLRRFQLWVPHLEGQHFSQVFFFFLSCEPVMWPATGCAVWEEHLWWGCTSLSRRQWRGLWAADRWARPLQTCDDPEASLVWTRWCWRPSNRRLPAENIQDTHRVVLPLVYFTGALSWGNKLSL